MLSLLLIAAIPLIYLVLRCRKKESYNPPPGPKGLPIIGNLHQFDPSKLTHEYFVKQAQIYGPILSLRLGQRTMVVVQSANVAKQVMQAPHNSFCNRLITAGARRLSYNGLDVVFAPYDDYYREIKKIFMVHLLSNKRVQSFAPIRQEEVSRIIQKVSSLSSDSNTVNVSELAVSYTTSIICRIAFGKRYEDDESSTSRFHSLLHDAETQLASFFFTDHFPSVGHWIDTLSGKFSRLEKTYKDLEEFYEEIINDHLNKPKSDQEDIIDILLQLQKEGSFAIELTMDHIKATLMMFVAGTDSMNAMIVWAMTELMRHPKVMDKVQQELRNTIQNKRYVEENDLSNLEYFKAVVKETFRIHPPGPILIPRETLEKSTIAGYDILPKTIVALNLWAINRDPEFWDDPDSFKPERFLGSSVNFLGHDFQLIPFGAGKRVCPGLNLGVAVLELIIANLLYTFDWDVPHGLKREDIDTEMQVGVVTHKKNPLCLTANKFL
ncbi:Cytochrome P450 83B1 [Bienertia sinuspersici]